MTKEDLLYLTLKQLKDSFKTSPECLTLEESYVSVSSSYTSDLGPIITWRRMIEIDGKTIRDPNNAPRTIILVYNKLTKQLTANIYFGDIHTFNSSIIPDASVSFKYKFWPYLYKSYRDFMSLRSKLIARHNNRQNIDYMNKLSSIFPAAGDDDLIG